MTSVPVSLNFRSGTYWSYQWWTSGLDRFQHGVRVRGTLFTFFETLASLRVCCILLPRHLFPNSVQKLIKESILSGYIIHNIVLNYSLRHLFSCFKWNQVASRCQTQGYRNFEIQIGPLDRWRHRRHTNMSSTIPNSHENSSFSSKSVSEIDYFSDRVLLQPVVSKRSKDNPKSLASDRCLLNTGVHQYPLWCLNPPIFSVSQRVSFFYEVFACV